MPFHWLDSNVFIEAKNGPYGFDIAPSFWKWLKKSAEDGLVRSPIHVGEELKGHRDQLARWVRLNAAPLFVSPNAPVQKLVGEIGVYVQRRYEMAYSSRFLSGADPWVIAHALENKGTVVTHEVLAPENCKDVKIPNVCAYFSVPCLGAYEAMRRLKLKL